MEKKAKIILLLLKTNPGVCNCGCNKVQAKNKNLITKTLAQKTSMLFKHQLILNSVVLMEFNVLWSCNEICFKFYNEIYQQNDMIESNEKNLFFQYFWKKWTTKEIMKKRIAHTHISCTISLFLSSLNLEPASFKRL